MSLPSHLKSLISLSPPETINFSISRNSQCKVTLYITNESDSKVVFKVKTTQPTWYYVRPNQQIIDVGKTEEVSILLVETESNRFLDLPLEERDEILEKHRFLVQSRVIDSNTFERISNLSANNRTEEFQKIWETVNKDEKKNQKLKVEFTVVDSAEGEGNGLGEGASESVSQNIESIRAKISKANAQNVASSLSSSNNKSVLEDTPGSPEAIYAELQAVRKKYDAVVEYTVHLTAERDYHFTQLEELRREFAKEKAKKKGVSDVPSKKSDKLNEKRTDQQQGFSLLVVILVGLISFAVARYFNVSGNQVDGL